MQNLRFGEIALGGRFEFRGRRYEKLTVSLAGDEHLQCNHFHPDTEVVIDFFLVPTAPKSEVRRAVVPAKAPQKRFRMWADQSN